MRDYGKLGLTTLALRGVRTAAGVHQPDCCMHGCMPKMMPAAWPPPLYLLILSGCMCCQATAAAAGAKQLHRPLSVSRRAQRARLQRPGQSTTGPRDSWGLGSRVLGGGAADRTCCQQLISGSQARPRTSRACVEAGLMGPQIHGAEGCSEMLG